MCFKIGISAFIMKTKTRLEVKIVLYQFVIAIYSVLDTFWVDRLPYEVY